MTLLYLSTAYLIGIALGQWVWQAGLVGCHLPDWLWLPLLGMLPFAPLADRLTPPRNAHRMRWPMSAGFRSPRRGLSPGMRVALLVCLLAGVARYASHPTAPCITSQDLAFYNEPAQSGFAPTGESVTVTGMINSYPLRQDTQQRLDVRVDSLKIDGSERPVHGQLRLTTGLATQVIYGQPVRITGILSDPPQFEDFDYRAYLARKGVQSLMQRPRITPLETPNQGSRLKRTLYALRARSESLLNRLLPEPYAALANGMLLGIESGIPDDLYDQFNLTGTSHVIVISGSNVALVAGVLMAIFQRVLGRRRSILPTLAGIGLYALLVGGDAAVLRAALMGGLFVWATAINRPSTALVSLGAACGAMTVVNPLMLWDVGFQLSSAATAGLILFTPGLTQAVGRWLPGFSGGFLTSGFLAQSGVASAAKGVLQGLFQDGLIVTLAANVTTLPLVVFYFGRLSLISLLTNILILPVQPLIMFGGIGGLAFGLMGLTILAQVVLWLPWLSL
ncbi:MAG: ComEC/Rec2 family competence protein, partial [Caldilineaceae bacterium]|nr:ComEC/Rec2 family competence protein [Caldilineaceae bacterium]